MYLDNLGLKTCMGSMAWFGLPVAVKLHHLSDVVMGEGVSEW